ncbi:MAG TPA: hypothetical protein VHP11_02840, partial [Tepidisphaeraceae bacterium]|nr:hypothetical protein [Tepidisphaeraceae bacterium]
RTLLGLGMACCCCAWLAIPLIAVETVLASGPLLMLVGLATAIYGIRHTYGGVVSIGVAHMGICILFVSLVNLLSWGPGAAREPFIAMGAMYILATGPWSWWVGKTLPQQEQFGVCARCGYLLYGLTEPRCPECGTPFDEAWLPALARLSGGTSSADGFRDGEGI